MTGPDRGDFRVVFASSTSAMLGMPSEPVVKHKDQARFDAPGAAGGSPTADLFEAFPGGF
jgi:hypothetical protein